MPEWSIKVTSPSGGSVTALGVLEFLKKENDSLALAFMRRLIKMLYFGSSNHLAVQNQNVNY